MFIPEYNTLVFNKEGFLNRIDPSTYFVCREVIYIQEINSKKIRTQFIFLHKNKDNTCIALSTLSNNDNFLFFHELDYSLKTIMKRVEKRQLRLVTGCVIVGGNIVECFNPKQIISI